MNKLIIAAIVIILAVAGVYFFALAPRPVAAALVYIENGTVEVDTGNGWQPATDEMELAQGAHVRTKDNSEATVVLLEGEVMHLQPNTEIKLDQISNNKIKILQLAGETLNKVTKISGITEYSVETPSTVATVRGTEFAINDDEVDVADGEVDYGPKDKPHIGVKAGKRALKKILKEEDIPPGQLEKLKHFPEKYEHALKRVRMREIKKHPRLLQKAFARGYTEEKMKQDLADIDEGRKSEDEIYEKTPALMKPQAKHVYLLTKEIKKIRKANESKLNENHGKTPAEPALQTKPAKDIQQVTAQKQ